MAIEVHWFSTLVKRTKSRQAVTTAAWHEGLTPLDLFYAEGFRPADTESILVAVNDVQGQLEQPLADGDRIEFLVNIQGG